MKTKIAAVLIISTVLLAGVALGASAMPQGRQGRQVPLGQTVLQYFAKNGVDAQYLTGPQSAVPADVQQKIAALVKDPGFQPIVLSELRANAAAFGDQIYFQIGNTVYEYSRLPGQVESFNVGSAS